MIENSSGEVLFEVAQHIEKAILKLDPHSLVTCEMIESDLNPPPQSEWGDFAFGCFRLSQSLKKNPTEIAKALTIEIQKLGQADQSQFIFESLTAMGPYLNARLKPQVIQKNWAKSVQNKSYFQKKLLKVQPKTMIEYSQPNTHKELHVGHMRNACLGDSLVRIKKYAGIEVLSATFPGDIGAHVAKCLWYLKYHNHEPVPVTNKGAWLGQLYSKAHIKLEDELGSPQETINREQLTAILKELENKAGPFYELWKETRQWSLDLMKQIYSWADIHFDVWYWESEVDEGSRIYVKSLFDQGLLIKSQGAIGMDLSEDKLGFCLLLKSDGTGLYATKDLELARRKFQEYKIERNVYIVDLRQALHFSQIFKVLEKLGYQEAAQCYHLQYNFVELPDGAMSSRKGNIVPIFDLIQKMEEMILNKYLSRYEDWSQEEKQKVSKQIALGAIKYGMLKMDTVKKIVFDLEEWLKIEGDSGPFIQYSGARIKSLMRKNKDKTQVSADWKSLTHIKEQVLMGHLIYFHKTIKMAAIQDKPHLLTQYLYQLAQKFNAFYHECPISQAPSQELLQARLELAEVTGLVLEKGLNLLGIQLPERM